MDLPASVDRNEMNICGKNKTGKLFTTFKNAFAHAKNLDGDEEEDRAIDPRTLTIQEPLEKILMKETAVEMIDLLDQRIQRRKDQFLVDVVSEAAIKAEISGNNHVYDMDRFSKLAR